jgi:hypothetical protein
VNMKEQPRAIAQPAAAQPDRSEPRSLTLMK